MDDRTWERYGALGSIWFLVLAVVGSLIPGTYPSRTDSPSEIAEWYIDNDTAIQVGALLTALGIIGLVWWFGTLWRAMLRAEEGTPRVASIALVGFVFSGAMAGGGFAVNAGTAAGIDLVGEGAAFFFGISSIFYAMSALGDVILTLAIAGLVLRTGFLPKWLGFAALLVAAASLVASIGIATDATFFGVFGFIAFLVWALLLAAIGVVLYQRASAATPVPVTASTV